MKRTNLENWICEAEGLPALSRKSIETLQLERLNALLCREKARGGFYADLPASLGSLKELADLPFTTPKQLAECGERMLLVSQSSVCRVITDATSGTTGAAKRVFYTEKDCQNTVEFFAAGLSELVFPKDTVMIAMPFSGPFGLGELIAEAIEKLGARPLKAGVGRTFGELSDILEEEKPGAYVGMPAQFLSLLRFCGRKSLRRALVSGDACPKIVLTEAEKLLGSRLFPHYGLRETALGCAVTCPAHEGMHLRENHIIAEIVGEDGKPVPDGEAGELCLTTIGMEAQPLIRYRTGDRARILPDPCPCGGVTKRIDGISRSFAASLEELDGALFSLPRLVDYRAEREGDALRISVLNNGAPCSDEIRAAAERICPRLAVTVSERPCRKEDVPSYLGKRHLAGT